MVSYEVSFGFVIVCVVMWASSFNLSEIVTSQVGYAFGLLNGNVFNPLLFPMAVVFFISALAETNRPPFDLAEAESELVAGYQRSEEHTSELQSLMSSSYAVFCLNKKKKKQ